MMYQVLNRIYGCIQYKNMQFFIHRNMVLKSYFIFTLVLVSVWSCNHDQNAHEKTDKIFNIEIPADDSNYDEQQLLAIINEIAKLKYKIEYDYFDNELQDIPLQNRPSIEMIDTMYHFDADDYIPVKISFNKGYLFDSNFVHMIFTTKNRMDIFVRNRFGNDISHELLKDSMYTNVVTCQVNSEIIYSSVYDVNGDGFSDIVIGLKDEGGCCLAKTTRVYLYLPHCGGFTPYYEFMNPTFFPAERKIRGIAYGHPGQVPLYEKEWIGVTVKDLRYIYPNDKDTLNYTFRSYRKKDFDDNDMGELLKRLPKEFEIINDIQWFNNYNPSDFKN